MGPPSDVLENLDTSWLRVNVDGDTVTYSVSTHPGDKNNSGTDILGKVVLPKAP